MENGIVAKLNVEKKNNYEFLANNKNYLEYIGSLEGNITEIPIITQNDGTIKSLDSNYDRYVNDINDVTKIVIDNLDPVIDYIRNDIFDGKVIMSQELVISSDRKVLALCDLSNVKKVLEIKTFKLFDENNIINSNLLRQLYYESNGRLTYALSIDINSHINIY